MAIERDLELLVVKAMVGARMRRHDGARSKPDRPFAPRRRPDNLESEIRRRRGMRAGQNGLSPPRTVNYRPASKPDLQKIELMARPANIRAKIGATPTKQRARRISSAERRAQLLQVAREIIHREGVGGLTMSALADAVGVTKPIVYKHFMNSEAVIIEVLRQYSNGLIRLAQERVQQSENIYDYLENIIDIMFEYIGDEGPVVRNVTNGFSSSVNIDTFFLQEQNRVHRVYRDLLLQQNVPDTRANVAAYALMQMIDSTIIEFARAKDPMDRATLKEMVNGAVRALVSGPGVKPVIPAAAFDTDLHD